VSDAPVEVLWEFPIQPGLHHPIVLCLQNNDELSFGVNEFWTYLFPFPDKSAFFERIIDAWVEGRARIVPHPGWLLQTLELQILENGVWAEAYSARSLARKRPGPRVLMNKLE
jgi:hypothetical protein